MNTRKRLAAMRTAGVFRSRLRSTIQPVIAAGQRCEHALVDPEQNQSLFAYEAAVRGRFSHIVDTLKILSAMQHETDFVERAQRVAHRQAQLCPADGAAGEAWVTGLDLRALVLPLHFPQLQGVRRPGRCRSVALARADGARRYLYPVMRLSHG
jgi:hypothetical protein